MCETKCAHRKVKNFNWNDRWGLVIADLISIVVILYSNSSLCSILLVILIICKWYGVIVTSPIFPMPNCIIEWRQFDVVACICIWLLLLLLLLQWIIWWASKSVCVCLYRHVCASNHDDWIGDGQRVHQKISSTFKFEFSTNISIEYK